MVETIRTIYLAAGEAVIAILANERLAIRWTEPSVLPGMAVGGLAGHLARSLLQVEWFLDAPAGTAQPVSAVTYYARLRGTTDRDSPLNKGVRARSAETAQAGPASLARDADQCLCRLSARLPEEPPERRVQVLHREGEQMLLDEYLRTRCVELTVHTEDLALSLDLPTRMDSSAVAVAVDLLLAAARQRHGDRAVLTALTRRERDDVQALRLL